MPRLPSNRPNKLSLGNIKKTASSEDDAVSKF
nr:MAG TPA: hypothetical protein [Caudoviricetes sp.]